MLSYEFLTENLGFENALPVTEHWSAAPDFLKSISDYCLHKKPRTIVECSSGTSSLVLAKCCQLNAGGHVYSLESGREYVDKTRLQLDAFSLAGFCDVIHAPLRDISLSEDRHQGDTPPQQAFEWYDLEGLPDIEIDMLVIDGPPGFIQKHSRYPALPLLHDKLAKHCIIYLDDAARQDEQELVRYWLQQYPEFDLEYLDNERGCSILRR